MKIRYFLGLVSIILCLYSVAYAATSLDLSGVNGGSLKVGEDSDACNAGKEGSLRYNTTSNIIQVCHDGGGSYAWTDWGG